MNEQFSLYDYMFEGSPELELKDGDIMVNKSEKLELENFGRSATVDNLAVLLWPRKIWTSRIVPYIISGHSYDAIGMLFDIF